MRIKKLRDKIQQNNYELTHHAEEEKDKDRVTHDDIKSAFFNGRIIKTYTHNLRGNRYLVQGKTKNNETLHVICRILPSGRLRIITVFKPNKFA